MTELIIVLTAAIFLMLLYFAMFDNVNRYRTADARLMIQVHDAANNLLLTRGYPPDWEQLANMSLVSSLGIASRRNVIDDAKLRALNSTNIGLLLGLEKYNISIVIEQNGAVIYQTGSVENETSIILAERTCVYNGSPCLLTLSVSGG